MVSKLDDITEKIQSLLSDEESMNQIKELAAMLSGGTNFQSVSAENASGDTNAPAASNEAGGIGNSDGGINPLSLIQLLGAASSDDKDCGLLIALRPHLSAEKQRRLDKAVKLLKLYNIFVTMRENGMLNDLENML
ncbi:MAG: hypothetical protein K2N26_05190 [Oscillospiraceae bacterium]|nr:hypothetical protein [Oscillospiraceae bacterium]MDE7279102.1 hypothetical protein [Oscillospiraceae bacterium]